jgi:curved DNA-binding protein CbpA
MELPHHVCRIQESPVTLDEALEVLGMTQGSDAATVRRAYLKLLRVHSPERDPVAFQRVRSTFELLKKRAS